jgi:hypothetical protein
MISLRKLGAAAFLLLGTLWGSGGAQAGTVILEGSDAIGFHCPLGQTGACTYRDQVWSAIGGADARPIAVIGTNVTGTPTGSSTHTVDDFSTLAAAGSLNSYVAVYFLAAFGCCDADTSQIISASNQAAILAYLAAGGTVMIENYDGIAAWDFAVGAGGAGAAHTAGVGGALTGPGCTDSEAVNATGLTNGFTQPPALGCWTHQAYQNDFFGPLGFTKCFFDSDPAFAADNPGTGTYCSLLSNGNTVTGDQNGGAVPEPGTLALFGVGLVGFVVMRRHWARRILPTGGIA